MVNQLLKVNGGKGTAERRGRALSLSAPVYPNHTQSSAWTGREPAAVNRGGVVVAALRHSAGSAMTSPTRGRAEKTLAVWSRVGTGAVGEESWQQAHEAPALPSTVPQQHAWAAGTHRGMQNPPGGWSSRQQARMSRTTRAISLLDVCFPKQVPRSPRNGVCSKESDANTPQITIRLSIIGAPTLRLNRSFPLHPIPSRGNSRLSKEKCGKLFRTSYAGEERIVPSERRHRGRIPPSCIHPD